MSIQTVKHHLTNIFDKVGVHNRLELALFWVHNSLGGEPGIDGLKGSDAEFRRNLQYVTPEAQSKRVAG